VMTDVEAFVALLDELVVDYAAELKGRLEE